MPRTHVPHRKMSTKKKVTASAAAVLIAALILGGAFAWTDFTQAFTNIFHAHPSPDVLLHDDFTQNKNKDVYVENTGNTPVYVRIAFYEYLQVGNKVIVGDTSKTPAEAVKDKSTYEKHLWSPMPDAKGVQSKWNLPSDQYYDWYVTGAQKLYLPGTSEIGDPSFSGMSVNTTPTAAQGGNGNALQYTIDAKPVRTMAWWTSQTDTVKKYYKGWILDSDGYAYWSQKLMPGTATNLLLDNVLPKTGIVPDDNSYYAIDVRMQAANSTEAYKMYTDEAGNKNGASDDAMNWLDLDSKEPAQNPDDLKDKTDNAKGDGLTDAEIAALKAALEASPVDTDGITAIGIDNAKKAYDAAQAAQDALNDELNKANPDADMVEQLARAADSLEKLGDRITDQCTDGQLDSGDAVTVDGNGFAKVVDAASGDTLLNALNFPDPQFLNILQGGFATVIFNPNYTYEPNTPLGSDVTAAYTNYIQPAADTNGDNMLSQSELNAVTSLYLNNRRVVNGADTNPHSSDFLTSLDGWELFPNLETLQVVGFDVDSLSAFDNQELKELDLWSTTLSSIDLTHNSKLETFTAAGTKISSIDLSQNPQLKTLQVFGCGKLTSLDITANKNLELVYLNSDFAVTNLNVKGLSKLKYLSITNTGLTTLDASTCTSLKVLNASWSAPGFTPCFGPLTSVNIAELPNLQTLSFNNQSLASLDVHNCTSLTSLECDVNNTANWYGALGHGSLSAVDVSGCVSLTNLYVWNQSVSVLNCDGCAALVNLQAYNDNLSSVSLTDMSALMSTLFLDNRSDIAPIDSACSNHIDTLDVSMKNFVYNTAGGLRIGNNNMTSLKVPAGSLTNWQNTSNANNVANHLTGNFGAVSNSIVGIDVSKITQ